MSKPEGKADLEQRQFPERVQLIPFSSVSSLIFKEKAAVFQKYNLRRYDFLNLQDIMLM